MDTTPDDTNPGIYSCCFQDNPVQYITEVIESLCIEGQSQGDIFKDIVELYPGVFPNQQISEILARVFKDNTPEQFDYHLTDVGNSERFIQEHGKNLLHCSGIIRKSTWYKWTGKVWKEVGPDSLLGYATQTAKGMYAEAGQPNAKPGMGKHAVESEKLTSRKNMIGGAGFMVEFDKNNFDTAEYLLNLENGTYDLEQHIFRKHERGDHLTKMATIEFNEGAYCPFWKEHLLTVFNNDEDTVRYFQEICGYSLLQYNPEQVMFILWGEGKNGKSETIKVLQKIHGGYCINVESESLAATHSPRGGGARPDIVRLKGARLVTVTEPDKGIILSEGLIKTFTADNFITARGLHRDPEDFKPGGKIFMATNHNPKFSAGGEGLYRKVKKIPFTVAIPNEKRKADYGDFLFNEESSGILNWMLEGLKRYQGRGRLLESDRVNIATTNFRMEGSPIGEFLMDECFITLNPEDQIIRTMLYSAYVGYCHECNIKPEQQINKKPFAQFVTDVGVWGDGKKINGNRTWTGIRFKTPEEKDAEEDTGLKQVNLT